MRDFLEKECVSFEQALKLKELGFNESYCLGYYENRVLHHNDAHYTNGSFQDAIYGSPEEDRNIVTAPTYQQAFRWLRDTFRLHHVHILHRLYVERMLSYEASEERALNHVLESIKENKHEI
jgi:hypothetical protein